MISSPERLTESDCCFFADLNMWKSDWCVSLLLWKIWVRQLGWWLPTWENQLCPKPTTRNGSDSFFPMWETWAISWTNDSRRNTFHGGNRGTFQSQLGWIETKIPSGYVKIAMENHHLEWMFPLKVIVQSYVSHYQSESRICFPLAIQLPHVGPPIWAKDQHLLGSWKYR